MISKCKAKRRQLTLYLTLIARRPPRLANRANGILYGVIAYYVPHHVYPKGYHCDPKQPLPFAALASQKNYMSLYLMSVYCGCMDDSPNNRHGQWFREAWANSRRSTMYLWIGEAIRRVPASLYIEFSEASLAHAAKSVAGKQRARRPRSDK